MADLDGRWVNRNNLKAMSVYDTQVGGLGPVRQPEQRLGGDLPVQVQRGALGEFAFVAGDMGQPIDDNNVSLITTQRAERTLVRASKFWGTRTYAFNETVAAPGTSSSRTTTSWRGRAHAREPCSSGTPSSGSPAPASSATTFEGNYRDIAMQENSYELRIYVKSGFVAGDSGRATPTGPSTGRQRP